MSDRVRIAVLGAGPRGVSVIERLIASCELVAAPVEVLLLDPVGPPGGGRVWHGAQPHHLLMNTLCADATHFTDRTVVIEGPVVEGPTLLEWAATAAVGTFGPEDADLLAEVGRLEPWSHPSRQLLGRYLEWCYTQDLARLPEGMSVEFVQQEAVAVRSRGGSPEGWTVSTADRSWDVDAVVIATGHSDLHPGDREVELQEHTRANGLYLGRPTNPISQDLSGIRPGEKLVVRGLGMNFFDYMSLLTVGRGGAYRERPDGELTYEASGSEPILVAGSRRGVPYRAKGAFGTMTPTFERRYLTDEHLKALAAEERQLSFVGDLWPHVAKDTLWTYYTVLWRTRPQAFATSLEDVVAALDAHAFGDHALDDGLARMVPDPADRLDLAELDRPLDGRTFEDGSEFTAWWRADLARDYAESQLGYDSALKCASVALGAGRAPIRSLARYGGFTGMSYAREIEGWFRGFGGALASGPPAQRIRELGALVDAGVVVPLGPSMRVEARDGAFVASSPAVLGTEHFCAGLLEAHLPAADALRSSNPLIRQLLDESLGRPFVIRDPDGPDLVSGALEVGHSPYRIVDADGSERDGLHVVGVPLESIHWGTQLGPLAGTNSRFLRDNDAVARAALRHGRARHESRTAVAAPEDDDPGADRELLESRVRPG